MQYYVKSSGKMPSQDYCWIKVLDGSQKQEKPPIFQQIKVDDLIESEGFSVLIYRNYNQLLLLITGLESNRKDFQRRQIRNSVAFIGKSIINETTFRKIAIYALQGNLESEINSIVKESNNREGFLVSLSDIEKLITRISGNSVGQLQPQNNRKIGKNIPKLRQDLIKELKQYSLPLFDKSLVIVTSINTKESLEKTGVWRGLSNLVESETWEEIREDLGWTLKNFDLDKLMKFMTNNPFFFGFFCSIFVVIICIIFSPFLLEISNQTELEKKLQKAIKQELNIDNKTLQKRLEELPELFNNAYNQASNCLNNPDNNNCEPAPEDFNGFKGVAQSKPYKIDGKQVYDQVKVVLETETKKPLFVTVLIAGENQNQDEINKSLSTISKNIICQIYEKDTDQQCYN